MTEEQLIENIKSDIEATMVGDNLEPLLVYLYAKDDLHDRDWETKPPKDLQKTMQETFTT